MRGVFSARFPGRCQAGDGIDVGDEVRYVDRYGDSSVLVHVGCVDKLDQSTPPDDSAPYCPACFCFHRGEECL